MKYGAKKTRAATTLLPIRSQVSDELLKQGLLVRKVQACRSTTTKRIRNVSIRSLHTASQKKPSSTILNAKDLPAYRTTVGTRRDGSGPKDTPAAPNIGISCMRQRSIVDFTLFPA